MLRTGIDVSPVCAKGLDICVLNVDVDFGYPRGSKLGILGAIYSLGAIVVLPFVPWVNDRFGRRWCILVGSFIMVFGAVLQALSQNCRD